MSGWTPPWFHAMAGISGPGEPGGHEEAGVAEHDEGGRPLRVGGDHVEDLHLDGIGQEGRELVGPAVERAHRGELRGGALVGTRDRRAGRRVARPR
jgi:hypothetical protein